MLSNIAIICRFEKTKIYTATPPPLTDILVKSLSSGKYGLTSGEDKLEGQTDT